MVEGCSEVFNGDVRACDDDISGDESKVTSVVTKGDEGLIPFILLSAFIPPNGISVPWMLPCTLNMPLLVCHTSVSSSCRTTAPQVKAKLPRPSTLLVPSTWMPWSWMPSVDARPVPGPGLSSTAAPTEVPPMRSGGWAS